MHTHINILCMYLHAVFNTKVDFFRLVIIFA